MADYKLTQIGQYINGENPEDYFGHENNGQGSTISMSADGSIIAIGATNNDGNGTN